MAAGAALLPLPLVIGLASRLAGRLAARIGPRLPLTLAPVVVAAGFGWWRGSHARGYVLAASCRRSWWWRSAWRARWRR